MHRIELPRIYHHLTARCRVESSLHRSRGVESLIADGIPSFMFGFVDVASMFQHFLDVSDQNNCPTSLRSVSTYPKVSDRILVICVRCSNKMIVIYVCSIGENLGLLEIPAFDAGSPRGMCIYLELFAVLVTKRLHIGARCSRRLLDLQSISAHRPRFPVPLHLNTFIPCSSVPVTSIVSFFPRRTCHLF